MNKLIGKNLVSTGYRTYTYSDGKAHLVAWIDRHCKICNRILSKSQHTLCYLHGVDTKEYFLNNKDKFHEYDRKSRWKRRIKHCKCGKFLAKGHRFCSECLLENKREDARKYAKKHPEIRRIIHNRFYHKHHPNARYQEKSIELKNIIER